MVVRVHGGIINDQMLAGSLRYFDIADAGGLGTNVIGDLNGQVTGVGKVNFGTGYTAADVLTVQGGTAATSATLTVDSIGTGGEVGLISITVAGDYSVLPANPVTVAGGTGTGATFNLAFKSRVIIPGGAVEPGVDFFVGWLKPVPRSAADQALTEIAKNATIVQVGIVGANTIRIAIENTGFGWDQPGGGDAAADMQTAIVALGSVTVPDNTANGATFNFAGATVNERTFAAFI